MVPLSLPGEESPGPPLFNSAFWPDVHGCPEHAAGPWSVRGRQFPLFSSAFWPGVHGCPEHTAGTWDFRGRNPPDPLFVVPRFGGASTGARSTRLGFWSVRGRQFPLFSSAFWPDVHGCPEHAAGPWSVRGRQFPLFSSAFWPGVHGCPEHTAGTWDFRGRNPPDPLFLVPRFGRAFTGARSTRLGLGISGGGIPRTPSF